jgi:hypothetical protein
MDSRLKAQSTATFIQGETTPKRERKEKVETNSGSTMGGSGATGNYANTQVKSKTQKKKDKAAAKTALTTVVEEAEDDDDVTTVLAASTGPVNKNAGKAKKSKPPGGGGAKPAATAATTPADGKSKQKPKRQIPGKVHKTGCFLCGKNHEPAKCDGYQAVPIDERWDRMREKQRDGDICVCCFELGHRSPDCETFTSCGTTGCTKRHHKILHRPAKN